MITTLKIKNWRSHLESEFKFSKGVNVLVGIMGSGKSSVMDALCFALFGTFPALKQRKLQLDEVLRNRPSQAKKAEVELDFLKNKEVYTVYRLVEFEKGTTTSNLRKNGKLIEGPNSKRVNEYIGKLLGVDYELFSRAVYSEQNQLDYFLNIPKGQRMSKIDALLRIDRFETARKNATSLINRFSSELDIKEKTSKELMSEEEGKTLANLKKEIAKGKETLTELEEKRETILENKESVEDKISDLEEKAKELRELENEKGSIKGKLLQINETIEALGVDISKHNLDKIQDEILEKKEKLEILQDKKEKLISIKEKQSSLKNNLELIEGKIRDANTELKKQGLELSIKELKKGIKVLPKLPSEDELEQELSFLKENYGTFDKVSKEIKSFDSKLLKLEKQLESLNVQKKYSEHILKDLKSGKTCPLCKTKLKNKRKDVLLTEHKGVVESLEIERVEVFNDISENKKLKQEFEDALEKFSKLNEQKKEIEQEKELVLARALTLLESVEMLNSEKEETNSKLDSLKEEINKLEDSIKKVDEVEIKEELKNLEKIETGLKFNETKSKLESNIKTIKEKIKKLDFKEDEAKKLNKEREEILLKEEKYINKIAGIKELLTEKEARFEELDKKRKLLEKCLEDIKWLKETKNSMIIFQNALKKTQESLRTEFIASVNTTMDKIWSTLYPYRDIRSVRLVIEEGDYVLKAKGSTGWINIEGIVSGGERSIACLALKIAFSLALAPNLSWLVLDEPTHNLDVQSIDELSVTLRERLPSLIDQIFLITHEERLESAVSGYLYKLERNKEIDEPTKVNLITGELNGK